MRWMWWKHGPSGDSPDIRRAQALLAKARADEPRVADIVESTQFVMDKNRLGQKLQRALGAHR